MHTFAKSLARSLSLREAGPAGPNGPGECRAVTDQGGPIETAPGAFADPRLARPVRHPARNRLPRDFIV